MTFSLVGRCERTGAVGAVIASASMAVAARCAAVRAGTGAVCSQSTTDPRLREALLDEMAAAWPRARRSRRSPAAPPTSRTGSSRSLTRPAARPPTPAISRSARRPTSTPTGAAAAGNLLADRGVPAAMLAAFGDRPGDSLGDRLIAALRAGLAAGGEVTPVRSAGMIIAESVPWPSTDLRVDWHDDPVEQLAVLWQLWQPQAASYVQRALRPSEMAG